MNVYKIPFKPRVPQTFSIVFGNIVRQLRFLYINAPEAGWIMDIANPAIGLPIVCGIPLVTGHDLLEQYEYLGIPGSLFVATEGDIDAPPTFENLGVTSFIYFIPRIATT